ncbi:NO-inducible flavohemoprotein [Bacillus massilinigeriensis]|uniref:NO-inducible flavohemoprotein n=1 Tax=Bacillus mediterraneensis TaxID=1805474 RepID=UPI0008F83FDD|nr:NO-inducible flavohemoprotein [Bacillus mediterraneensis]
MLDQKTIAIIKSTVPVLEEHGEKITSVFYKRMFSDHPELLNIFNHANQKKGQQQRALASAVYAAASYIDKLEAILPEVRLIAHKHRSIGIQPEQYPIVGKYLLLAIKEVLGEAADEEILHAWKEAYKVIADVFISVEAEMYHQAGWEGFRDFKVVRKVAEGDHVASFYLQPVDGDFLPEFLPGQYVSVLVESTNDSFKHIRQYSLSAAPGRDYYRITVKREGEQNGKAGVVSHFLHDHAEEGTVVKVSAPAGDFTVHPYEEGPLVLISGGVGITPLFSMLQATVDAQPQREVTFIHATSNGRNHTFSQEVKECVKKGNVKSFVFYDSPTKEDKGAPSYYEEGFVTKESLAEMIPAVNADYYFCGPKLFMKSIYISLRELGIPQERIHYEVFGPMEQL